MKDIRAKIYEAITTRLSQMVVPVYSFVPSNEDSPFIFIELSSLEQIQNKSKFYQLGVVDVELFSGTNTYEGSIQTYVQYMNEIKVRLQPYRAFKLVDDMTYWRVMNDGGIQQISDTERVYVGTVQYEFEYQQPYTYYDRVINDGGTVEAYECVIGKENGFVEVDYVTHKNEIVTHNFEKVTNDG